MVMVEKVVVMNCHVQQKVKAGKTVCDEASVVPWEVHSRDPIRVHSHFRDKVAQNRALFYSEEELRDC